MRQRESYLAFQGCSPPETNTFGAVVRFEARPLRAMSAPDRTLNDRATIANTHTPPDASRHPPSPLARRAVAHGRAVLYIILVRHETKTEAARHPAPPDSAIPVMTSSLRATDRGLESLMRSVCDLHRATARVARTRHARPVAAITHGGVGRLLSLYVVITYNRFYTARAPEAHDPLAKDWRRQGALDFPNLDGT